MPYAKVHPRVRARQTTSQNDTQYMSEEEAALLGKLNRFDGFQLVSPINASDRDGIESLVHMLKKCGPKGVTIAGGAVYSCMYDKLSNCGDIDFYFDCPETFLRCIDVLCKEFAYTYAVPNDKTVIDNKDNKMLSTFKYIELLPTVSSPVKKVLQLIKIRWYASPEKVINDFDLAHCQFAIDATKDTPVIVTTDLARSSAEQRMIIVRGTLYPATTFSRVKKYMKRGFNLLDGNLNLEEMTSPKPQSNGVITSASKPRQLWDIPEYREDYTSLTPDELHRKWNG